MSKKKRGKYNCGLNKMFQGELRVALFEEYPSLGARRFCEKYKLKISPHSLRCFTYTLGIKLNQDKLKDRLKQSAANRDNSNIIKSISEKNTKYNYDQHKCEIEKEYKLTLSAHKVAQKLKLNEYAVKKHLIKWNYKLVKNPKFKEFVLSEILFIRNNKDNLTIYEMSKRIDKTPKQISTVIKKLRIDRDWKKLRKQKTILFNKTNNPSKRYDVRLKNSERMKKLIEEHPEQLLNRRLRRNIKTSLEKRVERVLIKNNITYQYNSYVKLGKKYKFPDFNIDNKLILECDGNRAHALPDLERDSLFINEGYTILHFTETEINNNLEEVEQCILQKLQELNIQEGRKLQI